MAIESSLVPQSRRALLAGAIGGLAAAVATAIGRPASANAAAGDSLIIGSQTNNAGTSDTQLLTNSSVIAFKLLQNGPGTALMGYATPFSGATRGVYGRTDSLNGFGVQARNGAGNSGTGAAIQAIGYHNTAVDATCDTEERSAIVGTNSSFGDGVRGVSLQGSGVRGIATGGYGVLGSSANQTGVYGSGPVSGVHGASSNSNGTGVDGSSSGTAGHGVVGSITQDSITAAGVAGYGAGDNSYAGYFSGHVLVTGVIEGPALASTIDHPLDPANKLLRHSAVVSPDMKNVYDGVVTADAEGEATVSLPAYVTAMNRDFRYALTPIGEFAPLYVKAKVASGRFTIAGARPGQEVSWQLTGIRTDAYAAAHPAVVELDKTAEQRGRYLHPLEHGQAAARGVDYPMRQRLAAQRAEAGKTLSE